MIARQLALEIVSRSKEFRLQYAVENLLASGHRALLEQAITDARASGDLSVEAIKKFMDTRLDQLRQKPLVRYDVVIPLSFNLFYVGPDMISKNVNVNIGGNEIILGPLGRLAPQSLSETAKSGSKRSHLDPMIAALSVKVQARDSYFAAQKAWPHANVLASMIEFCHSWRQMMKFPPMPMGGVRLQNCAIVVDNQKLVDTYGRLESIEDTPLGLGLRFKEVWSEVEQLESRLRESEKVGPRPVASTILEALQIYGAAVNELDPNFAVLRFWIGLEKMMGIGQDIRESHVSSRLKSAFRNKPQIWDYEIERLQEQRNKMVHRGVMQATPEDAYFAKLLYGLTLGLLLEYSSKYSKVESITASFDLGNRDGDTLSEVRAAVEHLLGT